MGVHGKSKQGRISAVADGADHISELGDDVLLRILHLLPDARHEVRTGALSRRWRRVWTRLSDLRFDSRFFTGTSNGPTKLFRYVAFVNDALAMRGQDEAALEHLAISFATGPAWRNQDVRRPEVKEGEQFIVEAARGWIRHALRHAVKSFILQLRLPRRLGDVPEPDPILLDDLPSSAKLETMRLALNGAPVRLPAAAVFVSLTDLSLENMEFRTPSPGSDLDLHRFLSSACCPVLQKLRLSNLLSAMQQNLLIEAPMLLELLLEEVWGWDILELRTRSLQVLRWESSCVDMLRISAPRLEEITFFEERPVEIEIDGQLPCMTSLKIDLIFSHRDFEGDNKDINDISISLLQRCTSARYLDVSLQVMERVQKAPSVDTIASSIPHLPHVKYLTVYVNLPELHSFGVGIENILKQCSNLIYLRVQCSIEELNEYILFLDHQQRMMDMAGYLEPNFMCNHPDPWQSHDMSLTHLQEVEFIGLAGTDCELGFMQYVLSSAAQLKKVNVSFDPVCMQKSMRDASELIPQLGGGVWSAGSDNCGSYEWKPC